jgi:hypothetical protein
MEILETQEIPEGDQQGLLAGNVLYFTKTITQPQKNTGGWIERYFDIETDFASVSAKNVVASASLAHICDNQGSTARWGIEVKRIEIFKDERDKHMIRITCKLMVHGGNIELVSFCISGMAQGEV